MKNKKSIFFGLFLGYLISSYLVLPFPGFWFWFFVCLLSAFFGALYILWRRINSDILD